MQRLCFSLTVLALLPALNACTQLIGGKTEIPERRKFIIEAQPMGLSLKDSERPYSFKVQVQKFQISGLYDREQIVFRLSDYEINYDRWHIWANRPSKMLTDVVEQYLNNAQLFTQISQEFLDDRPDYILTGTVKAIERFDSGDLWFAHLAISMKLVNRETSEVFWSREFDDKPQVYYEDMAYTVEALSQILRNRMQQFISEIDFKFLNKKRLEENRPLEAPAAESAQQPLAGDTTRTDTLNHIHAPNPYYEIIPGKLAPEEE